MTMNVKTLLSFALPFQTCYYLLVASIMVPVVFNFEVHFYILGFNCYLFPRFVKLLEVPRKLLVKIFLYPGLKVLQPVCLGISQGFPLLLSRIDASCGKLAFIPANTLVIAVDGCPNLCRVTFIPAITKPLLRLFSLFNMYFVLLAQVVHESR